MTTEIAEQQSPDAPKKKEGGWEPGAVESKWYPLWEKNGYFKPEPNSSKPPFCIVLPPPNITGSLHLGHALTATIQDILSRWKRMEGFNVLWLPGTDHAGIATQMVVERELKKTENKTRHDYGREEFVKKIWAWKEKYGARIAEQHRVLGASLDWSRERFTMDKGVSEAVQEVFLRLHSEGLIYRARKLINWDPQLRTALSDLEVDNEERNSSIWSIAYPVVGSDEKLVVATTRPETMLGDTAVAVHSQDERYKHLIGKKVLLPFVNREIPIIADDILVDPKFGTGVVKVTPAHDHNDYATGQRNNLEMINIFTDTAHVNENGGPYVGLERFAARKKILEDLTELGLLVETKPHKVPTPLSQRTGVPVEPRLSWQWYVKIKPLADAAIAAVEQGQTRFVPESWTNTYFSWMRNIHDWCISRQLWWGHQIPAWYQANPDGTVDFENARFVVSKTKPADGNWVQDPDVLDTWFSSALWPFSTLGWPNTESPDLKTFYPNSVMETGHDIIFFWVARMMMMGLKFMGQVPFKTVYLHAMVRDEKGEKMSKTKGNVIDPLDIIQGAPPVNLPASVKNKYPDGLEAMGADALRFTLASLTQQGRDIKLSVERIEGYKAFCNKLWNASRFALKYMGDFQVDPKIFVKERALSLADRWILSRLNVCIKGVQAALTAYNFGEASSVLYQFLWREFCDWYIELAKITLNGEDTHARDSTRAVLVFCMDQVLRALHPFMPFITEELWHQLPMERPTESISLAKYPSEDRRLSDPAAEAEMKPLIDVIEAIRTIRSESLLSPKARVEAHVQTPQAAVRETLNRGREYLVQLSKLSALYVSDLATKPPQAAAEILGDMEIYVPLAGIVDLAEERERLKKEIEKAEKEIAGIEGRLKNANFVAKAPQDVVAKDRARVDELRARITKMNDNITRIAPVEVRIAAPATDGAVDLGEELKEELSGLHVAAPDQQVKEALEKLREGTKEGLSPRDHYDLGVSYMSMGLVDDAVREFNAAKEGDPKEKKAATEAAKAAGKKAPAAAKKKAAPVAKKKAAAPAKKVAKKKAAPAAKAAKKKVVKKAAPAKKKAAPAKKKKR